MPRQLESSELFSMPNLILDLDAASSRKVREYTDEDCKQIGELFSVSKKKRRASETITELRKLVKDSRKATLSMASDTTNLWRVSNHDIMSVAVRGALEDAGARPIFASSSNGVRLPISKLSQSHGYGYVSSNRQVSGQPSDGAKNDMEGVDFHRKTGLLKEVCLKNGVPGHAIKSEEQLMRWMLVKKESLDHARSNSDQPPPTPIQIADALRSQQSIAGIRRLVFQSLKAGFDWGTDSNRNTQTKINLPLELKNACMRILDGRNPGVPHQEALTFINNVAQAVPHACGEFKACIFAIRLRCLAAMGLTDFTAAQFRHDASADLCDSSVDVWRDIGATIDLWIVALQENHALEVGSQRQQLFEIVTGVGQSGQALDICIRSILFHPKARTDRLQAYTAYITLLGHLGAARTLWKEWSTLVPSLAVLTGKDKKDVSESHMDSISTTFFGALLTAAKGLDGSHNAPAKSTGLEECATLDWQSISSTRVSTNEKRTSSGEGSAKVGFSAMDEMMKLPFDRCVEAIRRYN